MTGRRRHRSRGQRAPDAQPLDARRSRLAAADLLSRRPLTTADLRRRLVRRGAPEDVAQAVVADLAARGYVDDAAFARHWVETRSARGYGAGRLRAELRAHGVPAALIDGALASLTTDAALGRAREAARRRLPALARGRPDRLAARLHDHLARRGFPAPVIARVLREVAATGAPD